MEHILQVMKNTLTGLSLPKNIGLIDVVQVLLIAVVVYYFILWIKQTRAYTLFKGMILIALIVMIAALTGMETILWIFRNISTVVLVALVVIFQPELRKMLEQLGEKNTLSMLGMLNREKEGIERLGEQSVEEIIRACYEMGAVKTGALIVLERDIVLSEYEKTGIEIDAKISSQLLINIFEHNTPLHDGAVLVRNDRIQAATCYLPLSDNLELNKSLGTRHRAGVGISEVSDALTIIVSEETGKVSYTYGGKIVIGVTPGALRERLNSMKTRKDHKETTGLARIWKGRAKHEEKTGK